MKVGDLQRRLEQQVKDRKPVSGVQIISALILQGRELLDLRARCKELEDLMNDVLQERAQTTFEEGTSE